MFKVKIFINYYILKYPENLVNDFFQQNFWYSLCRVVCKQLSVQEFQAKYTHIQHLEDLWTELNGYQNVDLIVEKEGLTNYGQVLSSACETTATCYNNYYIENFENIICNYYIYMIRREFLDVKISVIKRLVYEHVINQVLSSNPVVAVAENILTSLSQEVKDAVQVFIGPLIVELKNRLPSFDITKATQNTNPFGILPVLRHILSKYEALITENSIRETHDGQSGSSQHTSSSIENKKNLIFGLFPNPGLKWCYIKIDSQNVAGIFSGAALKKEADETLFHYTQRRFYKCFNFAKLKIKSLEDLQNLPTNKGKMFLNGMYTDGYTCRVLFCCQYKPSLPVENVSLELEDFNVDEVKKHFRPCAVDPGRKDVFVYYHDNNDLRRLSSQECYAMGGTVRRQRKEQDRKRISGIEQIETHIPSPKTTSCLQYVSHLEYMFQHMDALFGFYGFEAARIKWLKYVASQRSIEEAVNILLNGSKKSHREMFQEGDPHKMPLIVFGDGLKNKSQVKYRGLRTDINEFKTSKTCNSCFSNDLENLKCGEGDSARRIHQVLKCKTRNIFWNRDVMASKNMFSIAQSIWTGNDRPTIFQRQTATLNVVASAHSGESTA
ncbi:hypothetical protein MFLAVUS_004671 [Mucor flavus]|uniref:Uncharacterized protein n=1 Tax=Mucor flavus TaxID=439312 RepID=A0ABP9YWK4_9FUNG